MTTLNLVAMIFGYAMIVTFVLLTLWALFETIRDHNKDKRKEEQDRWEMIKLQLNKINHDITSIYGHLDQMNDDITDLLIRTNPDTKEHSDTQMMIDFSLPDENEKNKP